MLCRANASMILFSNRLSKVTIILCFIFLIDCLQSPWSLCKKAHVQPLWSHTMSFSTDSSPWVCLNIGAKFCKYWTRDFRVIKIKNIYFMKFTLKNILWRVFCNLYSKYEKYPYIIIYFFNYYYLPFTYLFY